MKKLESTKRLEWVIIGLELYVWPPEPPIGDWEAFRKWQPENKGIWACLKLRFKIGFWGEYLRSDNVKNSNS